MAKPFTEWTVLPHGQLARVEDDILTVTGELRMPLGSTSRRMTVVRCFDGSLIIYSAIALEEPEMMALEAFGKPTWLIVPSDRHRMDARIWKDRYLELTVVAPEGARAKVEEVVPVDATTIEFPDRQITFVTVPGTDGHEAALEVRTPAGTTLVLNELIFNLDDRPGLGGWLFHAMHMTGPAPQIPTPIRMLDIKQKPALRTQLEAWSHIADLRRVIVSHGKIIDVAPNAVLAQLAAELAS